MASNLRDRCCERNSRLKRGQEWISRIMSSEVKSRRAIRDLTLKEAQERHEKQCQLKEDDRRFRGSAKVKSQLKHDPGLLSRWDAVVEKVPAEGVGLSALRRSSKVCAGYTPPVEKGDGRSPVFVAPEDSTNTSNSVFASCFSALLMDEDDEGTEARDGDLLQVPTVKEEMGCSRLAREARIG